MHFHSIEYSCLNLWLADEAHQLTIELLIAAVSDAEMTDPTNGTANSNDQNPTTDQANFSSLISLSLPSAASFAGSCTFSST